MPHTDMYVIMDREISITTRRKRIFKNLLGVIGGGLIMLMLVLWLRSSLSNRIDGNRILTAVAEEGAISQTITAQGEVFPQFEQVISSSIQANIQEVLVEVGNTLTPGTPVLLLDKSFAQLELEKLQQNLALKLTGMEKLKLDLQKNYFNLQITDSTQALTIQQLESELEDAIRLKQVGGTTQEAIEQLQVKLKIAQLEKRKLEYDLKMEEQRTQVSLKELEIESEIQRGNVIVMQEKLKRANVVSARKGVLTWANENLGTTVNEGEVLARIADLSSYKVSGTCSDIYAERIRTGMPVVVMINQETELAGKVTQIRPTVENNILTFEAQLDRPDHPALRPNLNVEVHLSS